MYVAWSYLLPQQVTGTAAHFGSFSSLPNLLAKRAKQKTVERGFGHTGRGGRGRDRGRGRERGRLGASDLRLEGSSEGGKEPASFAVGGCAHTCAPAALEGLGEEGVLVNELILLEEGVCSADEGAMTLTLGHSTKAIGDKHLTATREG